ncbi:MAG: DUF3772 domain-containing protein [Hyphomicrobiales bacterium]
MGQFPARLPEGDATEAPEIANQRKLLTTWSANLSGLRKQIDLINVEADQHLTRLSTLERDQFLARIFKSERTILDPRMWIAALKSTGQFILRLGNLLTSWWANVAPQANLYVFFSIPVSVAVLLAAGVRLIGLRRSRQQAGEEMAGWSQRQKLGHVVAGTLQLAAVVVIFAMGLLAALQASGLSNTQSDLLTTGFIDGLGSFIMYTAVVYMICQPSRPELRLIAIETPAARTLVALMAIAAFVYCFGAELTNIATSLSIPFSFAVGSSAFTAIVLIVCISIALLVVRREARQRTWRKAAHIFCIGRCASCQCFG